MNFAKTNNLLGWMVCAFACTVYLLTMEATGSFWDCGEFIASCYKLQIPHPPGAPLFVLLGRFFIVLFGDNPSTAAKAVNFMSAIASGFTILFLFWTITHFARKIIQPKGLSLNRQQLFSVMSAGLIGALAYTFCDSFWYSAVEGEVYASSAFFTAIVFWAMLKWEEQSDQPGADKWLIFIFYLIGLSIGVHLLNLLTIPAMVMIYYFKRYRATRWGTLMAFAIGCAITGLVQVLVIQYSIKGASWFDVAFVNKLGLPYFTGFAVFFVLLAAGIAWGLRIAVRKQYYFLKIGLWGFAFMLLGYSTYLTTMIRSNADPAIDMFNVDNPVSLAGYLGRQQYGDWPILYGPDFTDNPPRADNEDLFVRLHGKYEVAGKLPGQDWKNANNAHFFPRMYNSSNERGEVDLYRQFTGLAEGEQPTMADNLRYFTRYQVGLMYFRYFMWNFSGKQNDLQGYGNVRDSNWISGIPVVDNYLYGNQQAMPDSIRAANKSYNRLYMLPFVLGLMGLVFQFRRNKKDLLVNGLLFFFTGIGIVIYLNQAGFQPRERDYTFAGSFYAFAIWIGLGVIWVKELFNRFLPLPSANALATGVCLLAVPVLMGTQEWNDHDRSKKTLARDLARDYLESCPPNAILISSEDNDTYPLWYAQEVEGVRPDVRIVITTLLGSDWYINQLRYKINQAAPADVVFNADQIAGTRREIVLLTDQLAGFDQQKYYDLHDMLTQVVGSDDPKYKAQIEEESYAVLPVRKFSVPVDAQTVKSNGTINAGDQPVSALQFEVPAKNYLVRNDLTILALLSANQWKRPICFTNESEASKLGLGKYLRTTGLISRVVPVENSRFDREAGYTTIMTHFAYGHANTPGVYFDEENRRRLNVIKLAHAQLALDLAAHGRSDLAKKVLEHFDEQVLEGNMPYGMTTNLGNRHNIVSFQFLEACYRAGDAALANKVAASLRKDLEQQMIYYRSLGDEAVSSEVLASNAYQLLQGKGSNLSDRQATFASDIVSSYQLLQQLEQWKKEFAPPANSIKN